MVSGNSVQQGSTPLAQRYGGHQFGNWADQLGDGRAHLLGEYINRQDTLTLLDLHILATTLIILGYLRIFAL